MADLIEEIGRVIDSYRRLSLEPTKIEVGPDADLEIKRLLRKRPDQRLVVFQVDGLMFPYTVNPTFVGTRAFKVHTALSITPPEAAIARHFANRSEGMPADLLRQYPRLKQ